MSRLRIFSEGNPELPLLATESHEQIAAQLAKIGVRFEQWQAEADVAPGASQEAVMAAYRRNLLAWRACAKGADGCR